MENDKGIKEKQDSDGNQETNDNSDSIKLQLLELETRVKKCRDARIEACKSEYQVYQELLEFERQHGDHTVTLTSDLLQEVKDEVENIFDQTASLIRRGKNEEAKLILQSINLHQKTSTSEKLSLLHVAVEAGNAEMTRHLIELGSDVEAKTSSGLTPLMLAVEKKYASVVKILIEKGKCNADDIDRSKIETDGDGLKIGMMILHKQLSNFARSSEFPAYVRQIAKDVSYVPKRVRELPR